MKFPDLGTIVRTIGGLQRASLAALGLTVLGLGLSTILLLPGAVGDLLANGLPSLSGLRAPAWEILPILTGVLGLVTAALCLGVGTELQPNRPQPASSQAEPPGLVAELRALLVRERQELTSLQETCESATRESMVVSARLASFVLDAETQLKSGVAQAQQALMQPASDIGRIAELMQRLERTASQIRTAEPEGVGAANAMVQAIGTAAASAATQIAGLADAAAALRRDAAVLDKAGREIAVAGASVLTQVSEAAAHVDAAASSLPIASETLSAATQRATEALDGASAALRADGAALGAAARETGRSVETLQHGAATLRESGEAFAQRLLGAGKEIDARLASLPALSQVLGSQAGQLLQHTGSLLDAARGAAESHDAVASSVGRVEAVLNAIPDLTGAVAATIATAKEGADDMRAASRDLIEAGAANAARVQEAATSVLAALPASADAVQALCAALRRDVDALATEANRLQGFGDGIAKAIDDEGARAQAVAATLAEASAGLAAQATILADTAEHCAASGKDAAIAAREEAVRLVAGVVDAASQATSAISEAADGAAVAIADRTAQSRHTMQGVAEVAATLQTGAEAVAAASERLGASGAAAATALQQDVAAIVGEIAGAGASLRTEAAANAAHRLQAAQAAQDLIDRAAALSDTGRSVESQAAQAVVQLQGAACTAIGEIVGATAETTANLARADATLGALEAAGRAAAAAGEGTTAQIASLSAICALAETQAAVLPGLASRIGAVADWLQTTAGAIPKSEVLAALSHAAVRLPALGAGLERIVRELPEALSARAALQDKAMAQWQHALTALSGDAVDTVRRLEAACSAAESAGAAMASSVAEIQSAVLDVSQAAASAVVSQATMPDTAAGALRHLGSLEREAAALMQESETLAQAAVAGRTDDIPAWLAEQTAEILSAVDTTIHRLRSVATAVAFASDAVVAHARVA